MTLRKGRHRVTVRTRRVSKDQYGAVTEVLGEPTEHQCNVQRVSSNESEDMGLQTETVYRIAYWPQEHGHVPWSGGPYSQVEWDGKKWDQRGEALTDTMSPRTGHVTVYITQRGSKVR